MKKLLSLTAVLSLLITVLSPGARALAAPPAAGAEPLVLAFYYAWYGTSDFASGGMFDVPLNAYNSADRAVIERQVDQAQASGIDAFVLAWEGPGREADQNLATLLDVAAGKNFRVAIYFETRFFRTQDQVVAALRALQTTRANHPAFLRHQGRPVVFFWDTDAVPTAAGQTPPAAWVAIRAQADPTGQQFWVNEGVDVGFLDSFDGHHLYSVAWSSTPAHHLGDWGGRIRAYNQSTGANKLWVATAMPGYDDTRTGRSDAFARARGNGQYYRATFEAAIASNPDWIIITSWNEWYEGSPIEPGRSYGNLYLDLTREYAARFMGAAPAGGSTTADGSTSADGSTTFVVPEDGPVTLPIGGPENAARLATTDAATNVVW